MNASVQIRKLLDDLRADFPRKKQLIEEMLKASGLSQSVELTMNPPEKVSTIPTFRAKHRRNVSPMLKARFDYASTLSYAGETWLAVSDMESQLKSQDVKDYHKALRENWDRSGPMLYPDDQLSLFAVMEGVPDTLVYLVWLNEGQEPEVWRYAGFNSQRFSNLAEYLSWFLQKE